LNTVNITMSDTVQFIRYKRVWLINNAKEYPSEQYKLRIVKSNPVKPTSKPTDKTQQLKTELKSLRTIDLLKKKLLTHFRHLDRLRYLSGDNRIIKVKHINKGKRTIKKYITELRKDPNFVIKSNVGAISLNYVGTYANCKRMVVI